MESRSALLADFFTLITWISAIATGVLSFLGTYGAGFGVIFAALTTFINWRVQVNRIKTLKNNPNDTP